MPTCIYCRAEQDQPFVGVDHVVPEAFWPFNQPRMVLECVCAECNGYLGRGIEQLFNRDSVEGLLRATFGLRTKQEGVRLGGKRLGMSVAEASDWNAVPVFGERNSRARNCTLRPYPTVLVRRKGDDGWKVIREPDVNAEALEAYLPNPEVLVCGPTEKDTGRLQQRLADLGIRFKGWSNEPRIGLAPVFANSPNDDVTLRAVAKIAFNFLAHTQEACFALKAEFDDIRNYIRHGLLPSSGPPVQIMVNRLLRDQGRLRPRHAVVLNWDLEKRAILCLVTLFGYQLYQVTLCRRFYGLWRRLDAGCIFDLQERTIRDIPGLDLWPPIAWARAFWGDFAEL